jgi:TusA-related sulfurtransferase
MKKLLHLYNLGHDPFPHIGKGGLGYHLPQYRLKGGKLVFQTDPKTGRADLVEKIDEDKKYNFNEVKSSMERERLLDKFNRENPTDSRVYPENYKDDVLNRDFDDDEIDELNRLELEEYYKNPEEYERKIYEEYEPEIKTNSLKEKIEEGEKLFIMIEKAQNTRDLKNYINGWSSLDTAQKRETTNILFKKFMFDTEAKEKIHTIKKLSPDERDKEFIKWISTHDIKINESINDKKVLEYDIPQIIYQELSPDIMESVLSTELESPSEEYNNTVNTINNMTQQDDIFSSSFSDRLLKPESNKNFKAAFSLLNSVNDLIIVVDGEEIKGTGGLDFEYKIKNNRELFDQIIFQTLGEGATYVGVYADKTGYEKSDYVIEAKDKDGKTVIIDLELKKYMSEQGKNGQDLAAYKKVANFDSVEKINKNTALHFNKWFYTYKETIDKAHDKYLYSPIKDKEKYKKIYTDLLNTITTNGKFDKDKLLFQHVLSGEYFPLPLTLTKFKTPSKEIIEKTLNERYKNPLLSEKVSKYMHHGSRFNKSENVLVPLLLVNNGLLTMNIKKIFGDHIPFAVLQMINNIYSKNHKDALGLPACFMSSVNLTENMIKKSLDETPETIKPLIEQELKERRIASKIKHEQEAQEAQAKKEAKEAKKQAKINEIEEKKQAKLILKQTQKSPLQKAKEQVEKEKKTKKK